MSSFTVDLEAQSPVLASPTPTHSHLPLSTPTPHTTAALGSDVESLPTHTSRHDNRISLSQPPRYSVAVDEEPVYDLPAYTETAVEEPTTLASYLFKFGFLFPIFWVLGAIILISPLTAPEDFHAGKPESEREQLVSIVRVAEIKWAKRCLIALITLILVIGLAVSAAVAITHRS